MGGKVSNVHSFVWKIIDTDISIRNTLDKDLVNVRKLAQYIIKTQKIALPWILP